MQVARHHNYEFDYTKIKTYFQNYEVDHTNYNLY
jgi:hypothetical protein